MIIATWNVNGIRSRAVQVSRWLQRHRLDVVCFQEIRAHPEQIPELIREMPGYMSHWHGAFGGYSGVSIHVRSSDLGCPQFTVPYFDEETRILQADLASLSIVNVYIPLGHKSYRQKIAFFDTLVGYLDALHYEGKKVVLCGDFNVAHTDDDVHPELLQDGRLCTRPDERQRMDAIVRLGLTDLFRKHHPRATGAYSWWPYFKQARARNVGWRIDYIFASENLAAMSSGCRILREESSSDHSPVIAHIDF
jgi:exodeoxyribonuclease-3